MNILYEFLDRTPLENYVTCLNYAVDKVVYFGFQNMIDAFREDIVKFLKEDCRVSNVDFYALSGKRIDSTLQTLRNLVKKDKSEGNQVFFDVTGGEDLLLVAFGMVAAELDVPVHMFDVRTRKLIRICDTPEAPNQSALKERKIDLTLDRFIRMQAGGINRSIQKNPQAIRDPEFRADCKKIFRVAMDHSQVWNPFSNLLKELQKKACVPLRIHIDNRTLETIVGGRSYTNVNGESLPWNKTVVKNMLSALADFGVLVNANIGERHISFTYKNTAIKDCLLDGGKFLEIITCLDILEPSDLFKKDSEKALQYCDTGLHLDWDGVFHSDLYSDVRNEIDVLSIAGYIPTFYSCKSGKMDSSASLNALYELKTVADRFGGKYAEKVLVTLQPLTAVYQNRAKEMGIEVRCLSEKNCLDRLPG